jgi:Protein DA1
MSVQQKREVTAVLVLYGLPRDLTAAILAHEASKYLGHSIRRHIYDLTLFRRSINHVCLFIYSFIVSLYKYQVHVWIKLRHDMPYPLQATVEEGLCQFVSMKYLESLDHGPSNTVRGESDSRGDAIAGGGAAPAPVHVYGDPRNPLSYLGHCVETSPRYGSSSNASESEDKEQKIRRRLRGYFRFAVETDESPVYGMGYRQAAHCCSELSLGIVLHHVRTEGSLPVV